MFKDLQTIVLFVFIYIIITVIELMICYAIDYDPYLERTYLVLILNMAPAGFITDYILPNDEDI